MGASMPKPRGEPHPTIPHLYRKPQPQTAGRAIYPNLHAQSEVKGLRTPAAQPLTKGLLSDATRGGVSPLGGLANKGKRNG
jgi:hypothetical protein